MPKYRLGIYDPDPDEKTVRFIGRQYFARESKLLRDTIAEFNELAAKKRKFVLCAGVFPASTQKRKKV